MTRGELKEQIIIILRKSKDCPDSFDYLNNKTIEQLEQTLSRLNWLLNGQADRQVKTETDKLDKGGMFNITNMKPENQLD